MEKMIVVMLMPFLLVSCAAPVHQQAPADLARGQVKEVSKGQADCVARAQTAVVDPIEQASKNECATKAETPNGKAMKVVKVVGTVVGGLVVGGGLLLLSVLASLRGY